MAAITSTLLLLLVVVAITVVESSSSSSDGFTIDLLHRDSPHSPMYNPLETPSQRVHNALRRSISRAHHLDRLILQSKSKLSTPDDAEAPIKAGNGEYLVKISLGTPSVPIVAIADTGSDIIWTQCSPCDNCYQQIAPLFEPKKSSSYRDLPCSSKVCSGLKDEGSSCESGAVCQYTVNYGDQSHTFGDIATDTLTLDSTAGRKVALPKTIFGCGHDNSGTFSNSTSGIVGLGHGSASLVSQLGPATSGKFSYCLAPFGSPKPSSLSFGQSAAVSGEGTVSTPIIFDQSTPTFYFLHLDAISVGTQRIPFTSGGGGFRFGAAGEGNIIIDSGTTLTLVPGNVLSQLVDAVTSQVSGGTPTQVQDLAPCYKVDSDGQGLKVPKVTMHFDGGDVELKTGNTFLEVAENVVCFSFVASNQPLAIYGNVAQQNFLIGYDVKEGKLTFKPTDCAKFGVN